MTKIMLVEDDKSLREIYGVRLLAEGYDIVSAGDGEEALAMAIKERPQLIISDVMMPKISGFDLLDILRSTTETRNIRVIMMTALSSEDQRLRGEQLGADRYLVKSQVGIEDVVHVVHEILDDQPAATPAPAAVAQPQPVAPVAIPAPVAPVSPVPAPVAAPLAPPTAPVQSAQMNPMPIPPPAGSSPLPVPTAQPEAVVKPPQARAKVITPINDPTVGVNLNELLNKEIAKEAGLDLNATPTVTTTAQAQSAIDSRIDQFENAPTPPVEPDVSIDNIPGITVDSTGSLSGTGITFESSLPTPTPPLQQADTSQTTDEPEEAAPTAVAPADEESPKPEPTTPPTTA
jgi:CheY-like chemotaxis protein